MTVQAGPNIKQDLISKVTNAKKGAGEVSQVTERLPSKHKELSSNPRIIKKKERKTIVKFSGILQVDH
jgi:hypothetical protein